MLLFKLVFQSELSPAHTHTHTHTQTKVFKAIPEPSLPASAQRAWNTPAVSSAPKLASPTTPVLALCKSGYQKPGNMDQRGLGQYDS